MRKLLLAIEKLYVDWRNFRLLRRGWHARICPYVAFGTPTRLTVQLRVMLEKEAGSLDFVRRGITSIRSKQLPNVKVLVRKPESNYSTTLVTDHGGYIFDEIEIELPLGWSEVELSLIKGQKLVRGKRSVDMSSVDEIVKLRTFIVDDTEASVGILSDIDDTILVSNAPAPLIALQNLLFKSPFKRKPVRKMPEFYRYLAEKLPTAPFFYLSAGPWNQFGFTKRFLASHDFPFGPIIMQDIGPDDNKIFANTRFHKKRYLDKLLKLYPNISWLLIGDDGQHDIEIYKNFTLENPKNVTAILIRHLTAVQQVIQSGLPFANHTGPETSLVPIIHALDGEEMRDLVEKMLTSR
ncbi:MAG: DUF2183 domain-containing protein [Candidatus Ancillula sp.]|jgi:phosphatidate phosphatase APP1|nr:DUF2183 domain-containing protein [Candidatus Ancillula sp.]